MPKSLTTHNAGEITNNVTRPQYLVTLSFTTPIRRGTRGTLTFDSNSYTGADMQVAFSADGLSAQLKIFDEGYTISDALIAEGAAGIAVEILALYGDSYSPGDEDVVFSGELGKSALRNGTVELDLVQPESRFAPNIYISVNNGFNHLPPDGTELYTPDGVFILRSSG